jgi:hypothetical protein
VKRHLITIGFLILAIACYAIGAAGPATVLLVFGVLAEGVFWFRLFSGIDYQSKSPHDDC